MSELSLYLVGLFVAAVASSIALPIALRKGLFRYPVGSGAPLGVTVPIGFWTLVGTVMLLFASGLLGIFFFGPQIGFILASVVPLVVLGLFGGVRWRWIWKGLAPLRSVGIAAVTLLVAFPLAELIMMAFSALLLAVGIPLGMQLPLQRLLEVAGSPSLLIRVLIALVVFAPLVEEFLFRGLLQSWLRRHLDRTTAIVLSALIFAGAHIHPANGAANLTAVAGVFVLGLFLAHLFERERTLWAPIALHGLFNGVNVALALVAGP